MIGYSVSSFDRYAVWDGPWCTARIVVTDSSFDERLEAAIRDSTSKLPTYWTSVMDADKGSEGGRVKDD